MRFKGLDLNLLVALDVLLVEKSVSVAAKRLCRTQPALSGSLARLRSHFQDDLLVSVGRSMVLTPFAESLFEPLRQLMLQIERTVERDAQFAPLRSDRRFSVWAGEVVLDHLVAEAVARVSQAAPDVVMDISVLQGAAGSAGRKADIMIGADLPHSELYETEVLYYEPYVGISRPACAERGVTLGLGGAGRGLGRVALKGGESLNQTIEAELTRLSNSRIEVLAPTYQALVRCVATSDRFGLIPRSLAREYAKQIAISIWPAPINIPPAKIVLQSFSPKNSDLGVEWLRNVFRSVAQTVDGATPGSNVGESFRIHRRRSVGDETAYQVQ